MVFKSNFVAAIKVNNKFLREYEDAVRMKFDSEYSLYFKNLDSRKALVKVSIDGKDVLDGHRLIINGDSNLELMGYLDESQAKQAFKFIKRTNEIEEFRGITPEDGIIRVEIQYEKEHPVYRNVIYTPVWYPYPCWNPPYTITYWGTTYTNGIGGYTYISGGGRTTTSSSSISIQQPTSTSVYSSMAADIYRTHDLDDGITVKGSDVDQYFYQGYIGELESEKSVISFKLMGFDQKKITEKPIFTNDKIQCKTCGLKSKSHNKYCPR